MLLQAVGLERFERGSEVHIPTLESHGARLGERSVLPVLYTRITAGGGKGWRIRCPVRRHALCSVMHGRVAAGVLSQDARASRWQVRMLFA